MIANFADRAVRRSCCVQGRGDRWSEVRATGSYATGTRPRSGSGSWCFQVEEELEPRLVARTREGSEKFANQGKEFGNVRPVLQKVHISIVNRGTEKMILIVKHFQLLTT